MRWSAARGMMLNNIIAIMAGAAKKKYITATGGTITRDGDYLVHTFTGNDNLIITQTSNISTYNTIQYLIVAGGGGGGGTNNVLGGGGYIGGGGGAGGYLSSNFTPTLSTYPIIIGAGGGQGVTSSAPTRGTSGSPSSVFGISSDGGGGGGAGANGPSSGLLGGSGGGAGSALTPQVGGLGIAGQGNNGGNSNSAAYGYSGGGGGSSTAGGSSNNAINGIGGNGTSNAISGTLLTYSKGGDVSTTPLVNQPPNTGNGGICGPGNTGSRSGGSGIIIISYYSPL